MATVFGNLSGYTIAGFAPISGSGTVPAGYAYIIFSYDNVSGKQIVTSVDSYGPGSSYTVGGNGTGFYMLLQAIPTINAL